MIFAKSHNHGFLSPTVYFRIFCIHSCILADIMNKKGKSHSSKAYIDILRMILTHELKPGQALIVSELSERLSMSATPIREAIRKLESEGLLEIFPRCGTFVKSFGLKDLVVGYEAAEAVEGMAAFLLAEHVRKGAIGKSKLNTLDALMKKMEDLLAENKVAQWAEWDSKFHGAIVNLSGNQILSSNWQNIKIQMDCVLWFVTPSHVNRDNSNKEHRLMVGAIRDGNPEKARQISQNHKNRVRNVIFELIDSRSNYAENGLKL